MNALNLASGSVVLALLMLADRGRHPGLQFTSAVLIVAALILLRLELAQRCGICHRGWAIFAGHPRDRRDHRCWTHRIRRGALS